MEYNETPFMVVWEVVVQVVVGVVATTATIDPRVVVGGTTRARADPGVVDITAGVGGKIKIPSDNLWTIFRVIGTR